MCSTGLTKYATNDTPENHMDSVAALAGKISSEIIKNYEESFGNGSSHTSVTDLAVQENNSKGSLEGVFS